MLTQLTTPIISLLKFEKFMEANTSVQTPSDAKKNLMQTMFISPGARLAKRLSLVVLLCGIGNTLYATSYTTSVAGDINNKANWTPTPPNFTTRGDTWNITLPMTVPSTWTVDGNVTIMGGGSIKDMGNTVNFNGHFTNNAESGYIATGTAVFGSEFPQAIGGTGTTVFNNLTRTNNGISFNSNCTIMGDFTAKSFIVDGGNTISYGRGFTVTPGNNLFTGTAVLNGKNAQTITGNPDFNNLVIDNAAGVTFKSDEKVLGDLTLANGTLNDGGNSISVAKNLMGTGKETGAGGITLTGAAVTISGIIVENLILNNAADFTLTGNAIINGELTFKAGSLVIGNNTLTLNGTVSGMDAKKYFSGSEASNLNIGTSHALGTLFFNQATPGISNNVATLTVSGRDGIVTLGNRLSVSSTLALTSGTIADGGNTITLLGNITGTGTESGTGGVMMKGASATISAITIGKLELNNAAEFSLSGSPVITDALVMTAGTLSIGNNTLSLNGTVSGLSAVNYLTGSPTSNLAIGNNGAVDLLFFNQDNDGVTNNMATLTIKGTGYGIVKLGNKMVSGKAVVITKGQLQLNDQALELNGTFSGTATDNIQGSASCALTINSKGNFGPLYFDQAATGRTNNIGTLTLNNAGGTVTLGSPINVSINLALTDSGMLADGGNAVTVTGNITGTGTETGAGGVFVAGGTPSISGAHLTNLTIRVASVTTLSGNLTVNNVMTFAGGKLSIGSNTLTLNGTVEGMGPKNCIIGSATSNLTIGSKGMLGTLYFDQSNRGTSNALAALNILNESCSVTYSNTLAVGTVREQHGKRRKRNS
jgi:hypothetical protein